MTGAVIAATDLSWWQAVILGIVEGVTEYLPVSSTGHLLVTEQILGLTNNPATEQAAETFAICIQLGAIVAVLLLYRQRIIEMIRGVFGQSPEGLHVALCVIAATVPTVVIGLVLEDPVRSRLFGLPPIAFAWLVGGVVILVLSRQGFFRRGTKTLAELTYRDSVIIGLAQAVALWPGTSRSLVTIIAAVALGLRLSAAVEFSFLLGLVTLTGATLYEGVSRGGELIEQFGWATPLLGTVVAFLSAVVAVRWMVDYLNSKGFEIFGWYRIAIGVASFVYLAAVAL